MDSMSFMIEELVINISHTDKRDSDVTRQRMLLPDPATKPETISSGGDKSKKNHTFPVGPQERASRLPFIIRAFQGTTRRSHCGGLHMQFCGLSMGLGERATSESFLAVDHLK
jgi:hypothetical protein